MMMATLRRLNNSSFHTKLHINSPTVQFIGKRPQRVPSPKLQLEMDKIIAQIFLRIAI